MTASLIVCPNARFWSSGNWNIHVGILGRRNFKKTGDRTGLRLSWRPSWKTNSRLALRWFLSVELNWSLVYIKIFEIPGSAEDPAKSPRSKDKWMTASFSVPGTVPRGQAGAGAHLLQSQRHRKWAFPLVIHSTSVPLPSPCQTSWTIGAGSRERLIAKPCGELCLHCPKSLIKIVKYFSKPGCRGGGGGVHSGTILWLADSKVTGKAPRGSHPQSLGSRRLIKKSTLSVWWGDFHICKRTEEGRPDAVTPVFEGGPASGRRLRVLQPPFSLSPEPRQPQSKHTALRLHFWV